MRSTQILLVAAACALLLSCGSDADAAALRSMHAPSSISASRLAHQGVPVTVRVRRGTRALRIDIAHVRPSRRIGGRLFELAKGRARTVTVRFRVWRAPSLVGRGPYVLRVRAGRSARKLQTRTLTSRLSILRRRRAPAPAPAPPPAAPAPAATPAPASPPTTYAAVGDFCGSCKDVAAQIRAMNPYRLLALGDFQYGDAGGNGSAFKSGYESVFAGLHGITIPTFGATHDTCDGDGAWECYPVTFFNANGAPEARGKLSEHQWGYSADLPNGWHLLSVNYNAPDVSKVSADLAGRRGQCVVAELHGPVYGSPSSEHPKDEGSDFASAFDAGGVDVILSGHQHFYERNGFAQGTSFTVGTGGADAYDRSGTAPSSQKYYSGVLGVLKLTLGDGTWDAQFITTDGAVRDSASGTCAD